jgi:hypothetical protein
MRYYFIFTIFLVLFLSNRALSQTTISPSQESVLNKEALNWLNTYSSNLNNIGASFYDQIEKSMFVDDIISQFENDKVLVLNNIDPQNYSSENIRIRQLLLNIINLYPEGVQFAFSNINSSNVFYNSENKFFFIKMEYDCNVNGIHSSNSSYNSTKRLNMYLKFPLVGNEIDLKPQIYLIDTHKNNLADFVLAKVEDKNDLSLSTNREEIDRIVKLANDKELEIKKKEKELLDKKQLAQQEAKKAEEEKKQKEIEKQRLKELDDNKWKDNLSGAIKIDASRLLLSSIQLNFEHRLFKINNRTVSLEQSAGVYLKAWVPGEDSEDLFDLDNGGNIKASGNRGSGYVFRTDIRYYFRRNAISGPYLSANYNHRSLKWTANVDDEWMNLDIGDYDASKKENHFFLHVGFQKLRKKAILFNIIDYYIGYGINSYTTDLGPKEIKNSYGETIIAPIKKTSGILTLGINMGIGF